MCINSLLPIWHSLWKLQSWARCSFCVISILCWENSLADSVLPDKSRLSFTSSPESSEWTESLLHQLSCLCRYRYWLADKIKQYGLTGISVSRSVVFDSLRLYGLSTAKLLCPWDSLAKNTGLGCHFLLLGIFSTQGSNPCLPHCRQILYCLSHQSLWGTTHLRIDSSYTLWAHAWIIFVLEFFPLCLRPLFVAQILSKHQFVPLPR